MCPNLTPEHQISMPMMSLSHQQGQVQGQQGYSVSPPSMEDNGVPELFQQGDYRHHSDKEELLEEEQKAIAVTNSSSISPVGKPTKNQRYYNLPCIPGSPFAVKLHQLLEQAELDGFNHIISWQPHGRSFVIHQPQKLFSQILTKGEETMTPTKTKNRYALSSRKWTSFVRQLNMYGFQRLIKGGGVAGGGATKSSSSSTGSSSTTTTSTNGGPEYYHEHFLRGKVFLSQHITCTKIKGTRVRPKTNPRAQPNFWNMPWLTHKPDPSTLLPPLRLPPSQGKHEKEREHQDHAIDEKESLTLAGLQDVNSNDTMNLESFLLFNATHADTPHSIALTSSPATTMTEQQNKHDAAADNDEDDKSWVEALESIGMFLPDNAAGEETNGSFVDVSSKKRPLPEESTSITLTPPTAINRLHSPSSSTPTVVKNFFSLDHGDPFAIVSTTSGNEDNRPHFTLSPRACKRHRAMSDVSNHEPPNSMSINWDDTRYTPNPSCNVSDNSRDNQWTSSKHPSQNGMKMSSIMETIPNRTESDKFVDGGSAACSSIRPQERSIQKRGYNQGQHKASSCWIGADILSFRPLHPPLPLFSPSKFRKSGRRNTAKPFNANHHH